MAQSNNPHIIFAGSAAANSEDISSSLISVGSKSIQLSPHRENSINISLQTPKQGVSIIDFGDVPNATVSYKQWAITNNTSVTQVYKIIRDPASRAVGNFFKVDEKRCLVEPNKPFVFEICYAPQIPSTINFDYFNVFDSFGLCLSFATKGKSKGPCLTTSHKTLNFICSIESSEKKRTKIVEFTNESNIPVHYSFDIDISNAIFRSDSPIGVVQPYSYAYVPITFCPPAPGVYTKELFVLIHYQPPIVIKFEAICTETRTQLCWNDLNLVPIPQPFRVKHGYDWFFENERDDNESRHMLKVRSGIIDFGACQVGVEDLPKHFSVRNLSKKTVCMKWCKATNPTNVFFINPEEQLIPSGQLAVFEVRFRPTEIDKLYSIEANGFGHWNCTTCHFSSPHTQNLFMPIDVTVRVMGHTFPETSHGWIPQCMITPEHVMLPPCVPPISAYSTFVVHRFGNMPLMFKLIPPPDTCFSVRPKQGVIEEDYRIIVVQLCPGKRMGAFDETWTVRLNGKAHHDTLVHFHGHSEHPILRTETIPVNVVNFPPTHPGCVGRIDVPIRNLTRHCIRYKFVSTEQLTKVTMEGGETMIAPNEVVFQTWSFIPHETGVRELQVTMEAVVLQDCSFPIGTPVESVICTLQHSQVADLVGYPRVLEFGSSLLESKIRGKFRLYNFGLCPIHFDLSCEQRNMIIERCGDDVDLLDRWSTVPPSSSLEVGVELCPSQRGLQEFAVFYRVRRSVDSIDLIDDPAQEVIHINYEGILPKMKVIEIQFNATNKLLHKKWAWMAMDLEGFNKAMASSMPDSRTTISMTFPEAQLGHEPLVVYLYLKNTGKDDTEWSLKRKQRCACPLVLRDRGISFRDKRFECPHRELFTIDHGHKGDLKVGNVVIWTITIKYHLVGTNELMYTLKLSNNRKIYLSATITVLPDEAPSLSMIKPTLNFENVYIGNVQPSLQLFWLYNNCAQNSDYEVDTTQLGSINDSPYDVKVLECLNPKGDVKPHSAHPIYFRFNPCRMTEYEVNVPLRLGAKNLEVPAKGNGAVVYTAYVKRSDVPLGGVLHTCEVPLVFSLDLIVIAKPIPTHSKIERIFFVKNQTAHMYSYEWQDLRLNNVLNANVTPSKGYLQPFETLMCKMSITTGGHPAVVSSGFHLNTVNLTEKRLHDKSVFVAREVAKQLEGEFIISKKGMTVPTNRTVVTPKPKPWEITIGLNCNTISPIDMDMKCPLRDQLKHAPGMELDLSAEAEPPELDANAADVITDELEKILWDSMSSKWLEETIFTFSNNEPVYYAQFFMRRHLENHLKQKALLVPSRRLLKLIINNTLYQVIQELFGFARVADESDFNPSSSGRRESWKTASTLFSSLLDVTKRSEMEISQRTSSKYRAGSDLGLKIKVADAW